MTSFRLDWKGPALKAAVRAAELSEVQATLEEATNRAKERTPVDTGFLRNTMAVTEPAHRVGNGVRGSFGNETAEYTFYVEVGARGRPGVHMIVNAGDIEFPRLAERIAKAVR